MIGRLRPTTYNTYDRTRQLPGLAGLAAVQSPNTRVFVNNPFSTIEEAIDAIRQGRIIVVVDAEDRENEGDFICAAELATAETVNFMISMGRGQLCMPILPEISQRLELHPMVDTNTAPLGTNYTVPVDHRSTRTGITAAERARTIKAICDPTSTPTDFNRPGHLFPLVAKEGGVLRRAGHTEAAVDLGSAWRDCCQLACSAKCSTTRATAPTASSCTNLPRSTTCPSSRSSSSSHFAAFAKNLSTAKRSRNYPPDTASGRSSPTA